MIWEGIRRNVSLAPFTTLKAGGKSELFVEVHQCDQLVQIIEEAQNHNLKVTLLGWGSNVLPSDEGVNGLTVVNATRDVLIERDGLVIADSGCGLQDLFLKTAQHSLGGLEFAVGIPGTLGGALVSNAGAYRNNISAFVKRIEVVYEGSVRWVSPDWMEFSYRDSRLRRNGNIQAVVTRVEMAFPHRPQKEIYDEAREYQRQRIGKQPPSASAGSFFKNVVDRNLAQSIEGLTPGMRENGVIPAGFLIEACGLKGHRIGGAMVGLRHANFLLNVGGATATDIRRLAGLVSSRVMDRFVIELEEEVLYIGDWTKFKA